MKAVRGPTLCAPRLSLHTSQQTRGNKLPTSRLVVRTGDLNFYVALQVTNFTTISTTTMGPPWRKTSRSVNSGVLVGCKNSRDQISSATHSETSSLHPLQDEFKRLYMQLELLKQKNMKLGNPHLTHKLSAMTEAAIKADNDDDVTTYDASYDATSTPASPNMNGKRVVINLDEFKDATSL